MIFFDHDRRAELLPFFFRGTELESIDAAIRSRMALPSREREQSDVPPIWKKSFDSSVISALVDLSHGRCAFCERIRRNLETYRFRPPAYAEPVLPAEGKDSYLWLAFTWSNLYPICGDCRPAKPNYFPVSGSRAAYPDSSRDIGPRLDERPGLYYPGELSEPARAFDISRNGAIIARGRKAQETVEHFNLNKPDLLFARASSLNELVQLVSRSHSDPIPHWRKLFLEGEFGGARYLYLRRLVLLVGRFQGVRRPHSSSPQAILEVLARWREETDLEAAFRTAAEMIGHQDNLELFRRVQGPAPTPRRGRGKAHAPIRSVEITTYKSLEQLSFKLPKSLPQAALDRARADVSSASPEAPCLLILGENATGKSSILEAVALACLPPESVALLKLDPRKLTLNPEYMGAQAGSLVPGGKVQVEFHDKTKRALTIDARLGADRPFDHLEARGKEPLLFAYGAHRLFGGNRRLDKTKHFDTLFRDDRQLSNPEPWLRQLSENNRQALDEVVSALRYIIQIDGEFESIEFNAPPGGGQSRCIIRVRKRRPDGSTFIVPQPLDIVSSGYRAILALVCDVLEGLFEASEGEPREARMSRAIILIDEIEAHLHPRWKMHVIAGLRQALPQATFLITSHDPLCVRGMFNGEVMALNRYQNLAGEGLAMPERVERVEAFENVEAMTIDQLLTSDLFQLLSTDDRGVERDFALVADILSREKEEKPPSDAEGIILARFRDQIGEALPFGQNEVPLLVQEAVAEFIKERRKADSETVSKARERAKEAVKTYLRGLVA